MQTLICFFFVVIAHSNSKRCSAPWWWHCAEGTDPRCQVKPPGFYDLNSERRVATHNLRLDPVQILFPAVH